ncbi:Uncharacterised protein [[Pasteurella] mairii]|uniref:Uncharacterized protein n=1 Tax=[Pasteurella] mairii TaxID=757 RepID=A0A379B3W0_9PAST|nr:Uncharacterised protein [[Pasteurella] mairii]
MLTIKTEIEGMTTVYSAESFTFHGIGSSNLELAMELAAKCGIGDPSVVLWTPETYSNEDGTEILDAEELECYHRDKPTDGLAIGVLTDCLDNREIEELCGTEFTFIYPNDHIYVTNEQGKTVFSI